MQPHARIGLRTQGGVRPGTSLESRRQRHVVDRIRCTRSLETRMNASILYRIAAVLLLLFAAGHTLGFSQPPDPLWGVDALLSSMRSIHFDVLGFNRTYWDFFLGAGFSVA